MLRQKANHCREADRLSHEVVGLERELAQQLPDEVRKRYEEEIRQHREDANLAH
jgi:hypothetical protein